VSNSGHEKLKFLSIPTPFSPPDHPKAPPKRTGRLLDMSVGLHARFKSTQSLQWGTYSTRPVKVIYNFDAKNRHHEKEWNYNHIIFLSIITKFCVILRLTYSSQVLSRGVGWQSCHCSSPRPIRIWLTTSHGRQVPRYSFSPIASAFLTLLPLQARLGHLSFLIWIRL
jgi:hypothetical protein